MEKSIQYSNTKFTQDVLQKAYECLTNYAGAKEYRSSTFIVHLDGVKWNFDQESEFFNEYNSDCSYASYSHSYYMVNYQLWVRFDGGDTLVEVKGQKRFQIEDVHQIFCNAASRCIIPEDKRKKQKAIVFIGHGKNAQWKELKNHLQDKHDYKIEAYEIGSRAGHSIRDILEQMMKNSSIAFLIMTAEDEDSQGKFHARENVIHELGLFQGYLGFHRAIAVVEDGTNEFSNLHGIQQLRFSKGNIKEIYGDVLAVLRRERMI